MKNSEGRLQQIIFTRHWNSYPEQRRLLFAINNNSVNRIKGGLMKSIGVCAGVSDMIFVNPVKGAVQFLELKTKTGRQSDYQKEFQSKVEALGYEYYIIRTIEDFNQATNLNIDTK